MIAALVALATAAIVTRAGAREEVREIELVARGMSFYLAGQSPANPAIAVAAGERVRFVLRNETPGMEHDLAVLVGGPAGPRASGIATAPVSAGQIASIDVDIPEQPGTYEYRCRPHAVMMRGILIVR